MKAATSVETYIAEIIEPTIADFAANPSSRRHGFLACVVTYHIVDYIDGPKQSRSYRDQFCRYSIDFRNVDIIAHAFKHSSNETRKFGANPLHADDVTRRSPAKWGQGVFGESRWGDSLGAVTISPSNEIDLLVTVRTALEFAKQQLGLIG